MVMANTERVDRALRHLRDGLLDPCIASWRQAYGKDWLQKLNHNKKHPIWDIQKLDVAFLLSAIKGTWSHSFKDWLPLNVRSMVFEVAELRNSWAHQERIPSDDALRGLDSMERLLEHFSSPKERDQIVALRKGLMRQMVEEESRQKWRRTAAKSTEGTPQAGLAPWRDIITPHQDVASGNFEQAEYAADLNQVHQGHAEPEYQYSKQFFARTYITRGLADLLIGAARRLGSRGGEPVINLQTNFGGGKTHSLIALYHLASGVDTSSLPGVSDLLAREKLKLPKKIARAVLVGQQIRPAEAVNVGGGVKLHTLWGHLAYQLGGKFAYEKIRSDDEAGTNPGAALVDLFKQFGPAVVLIDEWVAYARQLRDGTDRSDRLPGGNFDTQFTFAQALTEAAAAVNNVVVLVSIPASDVEVGGPRGRVALERLKNVVARKASQWRAASPQESFEIVRRRLFDPIDAQSARDRDVVIRAFIGMYGANKSTFPSGVDEAAYRSRMQECYPFHPELFDRLFGDWSSLDKFQRTRGVLRLMAIAISQLWQRDDRSLLITPANLPMDYGPLASEMKKYLEDGWDAVIQSDVDGVDSLPLKLDKHNRHFGNLSATRRVARTVYLGSAPRDDGKKGIDIKRVLLSCTQPGESPKQFGDALRRLSDEANYLYVDRNQYWYSLTPNVTRIAIDRAASNFTDIDADHEVRTRVSSQSNRGHFSRVHPFAEGPGDVPDNDSGVKLVILAPSVTHSFKDTNSTAIELSQKKLDSYATGPRVNRNLVVFLAAQVDRLGELRQTARRYLAWKSIVDERDTLNLTPHQFKQASDKMKDTSGHVDSQIRETYSLLLEPHQQGGGKRIRWQTTKVPSSSSLKSHDCSLAQAATTKLVKDEGLIVNYSAVLIRWEIDKLNLWSERNDLSIQQLWNTYTSFVYMPRLASREVLLEAIASRDKTLTWRDDTFAQAEGHDGHNWTGLQTDKASKPKPTDLLIHPSEVDWKSNGGNGRSGGTGGDHGGSGGTGGTGGPPPPPTLPTRFYAQFRLDHIRCIGELDQIVEHIANRLGSGLDVTFELEIRADSRKGFDENVRRTVKENATTLGAKSAEFHD